MYEGLFADWLAYVIIAVFLLAFLYWKFKDVLAFRLRGKKAPGSIVNWMMAKEKGKVYYYPLIEYVTESGQEVRFRAEERCEDKPMYEVGTGVIVTYLPESPKTVTVKYP